MVAYNLHVFGLLGSSAEIAGNEQSLQKLKTWNTTQIGLHSMMKFQAKFQKIAQEDKANFQFEHEMR